MQPAGFDRCVFSSGGITHSVYRTGTGPTVILMHELPGLSPTAIDLGKHIAELGYTILMPLFYGTACQRSGLQAFGQLCVSREFTRLRLNKTSKVTTWLRALARAENDGRGVAAIGMCLTGGLVLGLLLEPAVVAGVAAEPALPFSYGRASKKRKGNLGIDKDEAAELEALKKPLIAVRFKHDDICPQERLQAMRERLGAETIEVPEHGSYSDADPPIRPGAHSVLTHDHDWTAGHPSHQAYLAVLRFLQSHLPPG